MASTLTLLAASPHALKYRLASDGFTDAVRTRAQMLAEARQGPLRALLDAAGTVAAWVALPDSDKLTLYPTPISCTAGAFFALVGPDLVLQIPICGVGLANIEVRFIHSAVR